MTHMQVKRDIALSVCDIVNKNAKIRTLEDAFLPKEASILRSGEDRGKHDSILVHT